MGEGEPNIENDTSATLAHRRIGWMKGMMPANAGDSLLEPLSVEELALYEGDGLDPMTCSSGLIDAVFLVSANVRYVALYESGELTSRQRADLPGSSAQESDRYEELFVNPTLLTLVRQRGNLDCGGAQYVLVRYGNFYQLVMILACGHLSICFGLDVDPLAHVPAIADICKRTARL